jgi:hypothetical protein
VGIYAMREPIMDKREREIRDYMRAHGVRRAQAVRELDARRVVVDRGDGFGGHEFEYEQATDLFRCTECRVYEVVARDTDGPIKPCTGLVGYGGDAERGQARTQRMPSSTKLRHQRDRSRASLCQ